MKKSRKIKKQKKFKKSIDKHNLFCYNIDCSARWCGSMAEQLICNQQVDGSTPFTSSSLYGGIPERPKGADCKSVVTDFGGSNPPSPTRKRTFERKSFFNEIRQRRVGGFNFIFCFSKIFHQRRSL